mgnify:CR=1 FL=1
MRAFEFLRGLVPAEFIAFGALDLTTAQLDLGFDERVPGFEAAMEAFGALMATYDLYSWNPAVNAGRPFTRGDFFSRRAFRETAIYHEVYRPIGIDDHCAVYVPGTTGEVCFFGVERYRGADFSADERTMLELAQQHLGNARELAKIRSQMNERGARPELLARAGLTNREAEVLTWIAEGKSNEEIAILLHLRLYTVKGYVKTIFQKIAAPNRLAAALWALRVCRQDEAQSSADLPLTFIRFPVALPPT